MRVILAGIHIFPTKVRASDAAINQTKRPDLICGANLRSIHPWHGKHLQTRNGWHIDLRARSFLQTPVKVGGLIGFTLRFTAERLQILAGGKRSATTGHEDCEQCILKGCQNLKRLSSWVARLPLQHDCRLLFTLSTTIADTVLSSNASFLSASRRNSTMVMPLLTPVRSLPTQ